jgi:hypothetical protein
MNTMMDSVKTVYYTIDPLKLEDCSKMEEETNRMRRRASLSCSKSCNFDKALPIEKDGWKVRDDESLSIAAIAGRVSPRTASLKRHDISDLTRGLKKCGSIDHIVLSRTGGTLTRSKSMRERKKDDPNEQKKIEFFGLLNIREPEKGCKGLNSSRVNSLLEELPKLAKNKFLFTAFKEPIGALHMLCAINAPLECVRKCFETNPEALKDGSSFIGTPLHYACYYNADLETIRYLALKDKTVLLEHNRAKRTPLHLICMSQSNPTVSVFLTEACPKACAVEDKEQRTPLHLACAAQRPNLTVIQDLTETFPEAVLMSDAHGFTPMHIALQNKAERDIIKDLIASEHKVLKHVDNEGNTPLHTACLVGTCFKTIKLLIKQYPKALHMKNKIGETPYKIAKFKRMDEEIVTFMKHMR